MPDGVGETGRRPRARPGWPLRAALALIAPALGVGMRHLPGPDLGPPYLLFGPPILVATLVGGPFCGMLSTALASAAAAHWVLSAAGGLPGVSAREAVSLAAFVVSGLLVSLLAHLQRRAQERAAAVERAAAMREAARRAQELEIVGRLAAGIAHDFNNRLSVVLAGAAELRRAPGDRAAVAEIAEEIAAAGVRARDLTRQLLAFGRAQASAPVAMDLSTAVREAEPLLRPLLGSGVVLDTRLAPGLWPVRCDPAQVEQLLLALAANARDAMPRGGRLALATANVALAAGAPEARDGLRPGDWVRLTVRDGGEGMAPEVRERIFEPFFTTRQPGQGTGLGLSAVYGIVAQADGIIRVDSAPGQGTRIEIFLPRAAPEPSDLEATRGRSSGG